MKKDKPWCVINVDTGCILSAHIDQEHGESMLWSFENEVSRFIGVPMILTNDCSWEDVDNPYFRYEKE